MTSETKKQELPFGHLLLKPDEVDFVIYHGGCCDGFGSAFSAWYYLNNKFPDRKVVYHPGKFDKSFPQEVEGKNVLICDFSYKKDVMIEMISKAKNVAILDHHKSACIELAYLPDKFKLFKMEYSGAYLTWRYFNPDGQVPKFIEYIQDNDLWTRKLPNISEFVANLFATEMTFENYAKFLDEDYLNKSIEEGKSMVKQNEYTIKNNLQNVGLKFMEIDNKFYMIGYYNTNTLKSEFGNRALQEYKHLDFCVTYSIDDVKNTTSMSLRSMTDRTDVSLIAGLFGGGGHYCASGVEIKGCWNMLPGECYNSNTFYKALDTVYEAKFGELNMLYCHPDIELTHLELFGEYVLAKKTVNKSGYKLIALSGFDESDNKTYYCVCFDTSAMDAINEFMSQLTNGMLTVNDLENNVTYVTFNIDGNKLTL